MTEVQRVIGALEARMDGVEMRLERIEKTVDKRCDRIEEKVDCLVEHVTAAKAAGRARWAMLTTLGTLAGALGAAISKWIDWRGTP